MEGDSANKGLTDEINKLEMGKEPGTENMEARSDDEQESGHEAKGKKRNHRHTPFQIHALEGFFSENENPDGEKRSEIAERLGMKTSQVKYWFQNRRAQGKAKNYREENARLRDENNMLLADILSMEEALKNRQCSKCGGPVTLSDMNMELHHLEIENSRLKDELYQVSLLASHMADNDTGGLDNKADKAL